MTENSVPISITINVGKAEYHYQKAITYSDIEDTIQGLVIEIGQRVIQASIQDLDNRMVAAVPKTWQNAGTEERSLTSSLGVVRYKRRVYLDENRKRRKPVDEVLGLRRSGRMSIRVQEMGSYLACNGTYRQAAYQLSWLIKTPISHSAIQRMAWNIGSRIADGEEAQRKRVFENGEQQKSGKIEAPCYMARVMVSGYTCSEKSAGQQKFGWLS